MLSKFGKNDGGRETWALNFLPELLKYKNVKLTVWGFRRTEDTDNSKLIGAFGKNDQQVEVNLLVGEKSYFPRFIVMFFKLRKKLHNYNGEGPEFVLTMGIIELAIVLLLPFYKQKKKIVWLRSIFLNEKAYRIPKILLPVAQKLEKYILDKADIILANGDDIESHYNNLGFNVNVIKNGVEINKWKMPLPVISDKIRIAYVGRLSKVKGIESFFKFVDNVYSRNLGDFFEFHVVGEAGAYREKITSLKSKGLIKYHNQISNDELPIFLQKIEICVAFTFASKALGGGGTSNALMEQMAASKIILAWDNPIFRQLLNNENAYLVKQGSIVELVDAVLNIRQNPDEALSKAKLAEITIAPYSIYSQVEKFSKVVKI